MTDRRILTINNGTSARVTVAVLNALIREAEEQVTPESDVHRWNGHERDLAQVTVRANSDGIAVVIPHVGRLR